MDHKTRYIIIAYCAAIVVALLYVPWKIDRHTEHWSGAVDQGYAFFLSPPAAIATVNTLTLGIEVAVITAVALVVYLLKDKIFGN